MEHTTLFGKYRIISTLGAGSSSTVYLAEHLILKVYRAIKCIPKDTVRRVSAGSEEFPLAEANLLKTLNHPGIPLIYDIDEDEYNIYMIEEFIQGDSLETLVLHQETIPQEQIIAYGIQLSGILDYLHHLAPYPILYQDLKPEHIILCGNQIKLIDFGIASFITGSGKNFQICGTDGFVPPEALSGEPVGTTCDIYGLGKVLSFLAENTVCTDELLHIIKKASAPSPDERYQTAAELRAALMELSCGSVSAESLKNPACQTASHLIRNIAVTGSRPGAGATHFAISLVCTLNKKGIPCAYIPVDHPNALSAITDSEPFFREKNGIFSRRYFSGIPDYGPGIENPLPEYCITVKDYGTCLSELPEATDSDLTIFIMSGSSWDMAASLTAAGQLKERQNTLFICNFGNQRAAEKYARTLREPVYCFPADCNPFAVTAGKERLISQLLNGKEMKHHFWHWRKRNKTAPDYRSRGLSGRSRRYASGNRTV